MVPATGIIKITAETVSALPFSATAKQLPIAEEPTHAGIGLPFAVAPPPRDERSRSVPTAGLPFVQTGSWPAATGSIQPTHAPPQAPPPVAAVRSVVPGRIAPRSPTVPPIPQMPTEVAPPLPVNLVAVPPPLPVRQSVQSTPLPLGPDASVWGGSGTANRPEAASGQTMGQLAAAAAATAALSPTHDGSSGVLGASNAAANNSGLSKIVNELEERLAHDDLDDPAPTKDPVEIEDTRDIFEILIRAASQDVDQLGEQLQSAVRPGGKFVPSLLLHRGRTCVPV